MQGRVQRTIRVAGSLSDPSFESFSRYLANEEEDFLVSGSHCATVVFVSSGSMRNLILSAYQALLFIALPRKGNTSFKPS
jgi:hypothetical protein